MKRFGRKKEFTTTRIIAVGFFVAIVIGTFLLMLPLSSKTGKVTGIVDYFDYIGMCDRPCDGAYIRTLEFVWTGCDCTFGAGWRLRCNYVYHDVYVDSAPPDWHERKTFDSGCV